MSDKLPPRILIIESNGGVSVSLSNIIERSWFNLVRVSTQEKALISINYNRPDLIVIDSMVQDVHATMIANKIRETSPLVKVPIIFLIDLGETSANYTIDDNSLVAMLRKPFNSSQLMTLIRNLLRRSQMVLQDKIIKYKNVRMDLTTYAVYSDNKTVHLGPTEFRILQLFIQHPTTVFSRKKIIEHIWGNDKVIDHRTVDVHINRIRVALGSSKNSEQFIKTVRSLGYCLDLPSEHAAIDE